MIPHNYWQLFFTKLKEWTLICVAPCIFVILVNFVANKCTLFISFLYKNKTKSMHLLATKFTSIKEWTSTLISIGWNADFITRESRSHKFKFRLSRFRTNCRIRIYSMHTICEWSRKLKPSEKFEPNPAYAQQHIICNVAFNWNSFNVTFMYIFNV
jgi:hypothetical protein